MKSKVTVLVAALSLAGSWSAAQATDTAREDAMLTNAKVSLTQAVGIAEQQGSGHAVTADYTPKSGGMGHYSIKVLSSDGKKLTEYQVNPSTGKVTEASNEAFEKMFTRLKPETLENAATSLKGAIKAAEAQSGGKAVDADADRDGNEVRYTVKVAMADGSTQKVKVNGADGKVAMAK
jgi:uncharacterized membrane protein YkoI